MQGAKIYLRAEIDGDASAKEGSAISYNDVLDHIGMTVSKDGVVIASNKTAKLFSQLDAADGLKSNVFIAEVGPKTDPVDLEVTIDVAPAMGNAFQEAAAHITFVFSVEDNELPPPPLELDKHDAYICGYPDGTVKPERQITRAEVATIFFRLLTDDARQRNWSSENNFSDVSADKWYNNAVSTLCHMGVLGGYSDGTFRPNAPITRAEFAKIDVSFAQANGSAVYSYFTDVKTTDWFAPYVTAAKDSSLIEGYSDGSFKPENRITRAEACAIVNRTLGRKPSKAHMKISDRIDWPDVQTTDWFYEAIMEATNSHTYLGAPTETWTSLTATPDWSQYE